MNGRWMTGVFGLWENTDVGQLAATLPNDSTFGLWLALFPLWARYKLTASLMIFVR